MLINLSTKVQRLTGQRDEERSSSVTPRSERHATFAPGARSDPDLSSPGPPPRSHRETVQAVIQDALDMLLISPESDPPFGAV